MNKSDLIKCSILLLSTHATGDNISLKKHQITSGGGTSQSNDIVLRGSIALISNQQSNNTLYQLKSGIWFGNDLSANDLIFKDNFEGENL